MKLFTQSLYRWYRKSLRNSKYRWLIVLSSLIYLLSPIDLITDVVPVVGWVDDGIIVTLLMTELSQFVLERRQTRKSKAVDAEIV